MRSLPKFSILIILILAAYLAGCDSTAEAPETYIRSLEEYKGDCDQLPGRKKVACIASIEQIILTYQQEIGDRNQQLTAEQRSSFEGEIEEAVAALPILLETVYQPEAICQVNDLGVITCTYIETLLGSYEADFAEIISNDIESLYLNLGLDHTKPILAGCGNGTWDTLQPSEVGAESVEDVAENIDNHSPGFLDYCLGVRGQGVDPVISPAEYSGLTGFDPFGGLGACSTGSVAAPSIGELMFAFFGAMETSCNPSLQSSMMEGGDAEETPEPPEETPDESPEPSRTLPPDEQIKETQSATGSEGAVDIIEYEDGTNVKITTDTDGQTTIIITFPDGQTDWRIIDATGRKIEDGTTRDGGYVNKYNADGSVTTINSDGTKWTRFTDGWSVYQHWNGGAWLYNPDGSFAKEIVPPLSPGECLDEFCESCSDMSALVPNLINDCVSGGPGFLCQAFMGASSCCNNPNAFPVNPGLIIPDPEGNFICSDGAGFSPTTSCQERCKVASMEEDCLSNCGMIGEMGLIQFNALDAICLMATWDACFESEFPDLGVEGGFNPVGGLGPQPAPETDLEVIDNLLFDPLPDKP